MFDHGLCAECSPPWIESTGGLAGHRARTAALCLHQHVHHQVVDLYQSLGIHLFTCSHLCSASATRNFVHSVSTLFEIILLVLLGNDLSTITRGNGVKHLCQDLQLIELLAGPEEAVALGLVGFASVLAARLLACIITSSIITRFNLED